MRLNGHKGYPERLIIRGEVWVIKFVKTLPGRGWGLCDPSEKLITLRHTLPKGQLLATLIHEIIHAIEYEYDFELPNHDDLETLDEGLADVILQNMEKLAKIFSR